MRCCNFWILYRKEDNITKNYKYKNNSKMQCKFRKFNKKECEKRAFWKKSDNEIYGFLKLIDYLSKMNEVAIRI